MSDFILYFINGRIKPALKIFIGRHSPIKGFDKVEFQKRSEQYCIDVGGAVACYGETELTKEQYYKMFGRDFMKHYDRVRKMYGSEIGFPHVYDKISKAGREGQK